MRSRSRAFTLIELLVVVAIIAVLIAILLPSLSKANQAKTTACASNVKTIWQGIALYAADFDGNLVPFKMGGYKSKNQYWYQPQLLGMEWGRNSSARF